MLDAETHGKAVEIIKTIIVKTKKIFSFESLSKPKRTITKLKIKEINVNPLFVIAVIPAVIAVKRIKYTSIEHKLNACLHNFFSCDTLIDIFEYALG